jgi:hypothetical protein
MPREIENLGRELLLEAPSFFALLFAGSALFMGELDPYVRAQL